MSLKVRSHTGGFHIYRETSAVLLRGFIGGMVLWSGAGALIYFRAGVEPAMIASAVLGLAGLFVVLSTLRLLPRLKENKGEVVFDANPEGLILAPNTGMTPVHYPWKHIERIVLTKRLRTRTDEGRSVQRNKAIVYFRFEATGVRVKLARRSKQDLWQSPEGHNITSVSMPNEHLDMVSQMLLNTVPDDVTVDYFAETRFDFERNEESFSH